jgi:hypothetical protein
MSTVAVTATPARAIAVEAELNYLRDTGTRPVAYTFEPPPGVPRYSGVREPYRVVIRNGRLSQYARGFSLDRTGFELHRYETAVEDFDDEVAIRNNYYRETEDLIKRVTGAVKVVVFDHTLRDGTQNHRRSGVREPVRAVHNDQTFVSGPRRVRDHLPPEEAQARLQRRFAILNAWRPIGHSVEQSPLAVCDARTLAFGDLVPSDLVYPDKIGETYAVKYNPRHLWYYFPKMAPSKFCCSRSSIRVRAVRHARLRTPRSKIPPPRQRPYRAAASSCARWCFGRGRPYRRAASNPSRTATVRHVKNVNSRDAASGPLSSPNSPNRDASNQRALLSHRSRQTTPASRFTTTVARRRASMNTKRLCSPVHARIRRSNAGSWINSGRRRKIGRR